MKGEKEEREREREREGERERDKRWATQKRREVGNFGWRNIEMDVKNVEILKTDV